MTYPDGYRDGYAGVIVIPTRDSPFSEPKIINFFDLLEATGDDEDARLAKRLLAVLDEVASREKN